MKISICGKGGSGKSTVVTLLALEARDRGYRPVVVDTDESNVVLYRMLGLPQPPVSLVELAGGKKMVRKLMPPKYEPKEPALDTNVLSRERLSLADIPSANVAEKDGVRLITIGKILQPLEGCACPMGVLGREFLARLQLEKDEIVIVDTEAGVEHFGRGVETSIDCVLIVVEPSFESLALAEKVKQLAGGLGLEKIWAVLNKANSDEMVSKLSRQLTQRGIAVIGSVPYDEEIFDACLEGKALAIGNTKAEIKKIFDTIIKGALTETTKAGS
ncbi:MAG: ATP-binding protein [Dehalococcoidia bacterium]|nr:ATP-binding protein [Dehalococcoidia bacterium]